MDDQILLDLNVAIRLLSRLWVRFEKGGVEEPLLDEALDHLRAIREELEGLL
jgi:hypothetical protein